MLFVIKRLINKILLMRILGMKFILFCVEYNYLYYVNYNDTICLWLVRYKYFLQFTK